MATPTTPITAKFGMGTMIKSKSRMTMQCFKKLQAKGKFKLVDNWCECSWNMRYFSRKRTRPAKQYRVSRGIVGDFDRSYKEESLFNVLAKGTLYQSY